MRGVKTAGVHIDEVVFKHCSKSDPADQAASVFVPPFLRFNVDTETLS